MARSEQRAWQRMLSGRRLDLLNPSPLDVEITDIAHGLARVARWNGQTTGDYAFSVAQHSILVLNIYVAMAGRDVPKYELYALLHDAPEYVMGDIISPFKAVMGGNYKDIENHLLDAIHARFSLPARRPANISKTIKKADRHAAYFEAVHLAGFEVDEARTLFGKPDLPDFDIEGFSELIRPWPTQESQDRFLSSFEGISGRL
ncbi:MAG: HD family hydrolase [Hyphomicrobiaceae bacterium]|nr:HD family hydrolase [Hyphomicrobiaceae bacterium]MCC0023083.1 HD family hydrolase [Hyphomicrobiaceae bacterium]